VAPNAVGSASYGRDFARRLTGRWGELDLPQVQAVVAQLQAEGLADTRLACAGKSYGGFLAAWAIGHCDLFKAAAVSAPVANLLSHMGTSDTGYYVTPFAMGCGPEDDPERYRRLSPVTYCQQVTAATLLLQGENDGRCPRGQSEELFANLVRCGKAEVELVMYPQGSHAEAESGRPRNRVDYHQRLARWVDTHANPRDASPA
jgi:dipeptidyl aminopeptidase/acylaminoacyl peptidase